MRKEEIPDEIVRVILKFSVDPIRAEKNYRQR